MATEQRPKPDAAFVNVFVFHMAIDCQALAPYIEAEVSPDLIPEGFDYYAAGTCAWALSGQVQNWLLAYSGCTETVGYDEATNKKGFFMLM